MTEKIHPDVQKERKEARATHRISVKAGEKYAYLLTGAHPTFNIREEVEMYNDTKRGISRIEEVFVRTKRRGWDVIEKYTPDGEVEIYPKIGPNSIEELKKDIICGQEILVIPSFVSEITQQNIGNLPESEIPAEFARRQTEYLLDTEL